MLQKNKKGFSLIELVITIAIIGILAFVLITNFSLEPAKLTAARETLINDIRYAQSLAYNQGNNIRIEFFPNSERYVLTQNSGGSYIQIPNPSDRSSPYEIDYTNDKKFQGIEIENVNLAGFNILEFDWQGIPYTATAPLTSDGTITIGNTSGSVTIRVTPDTGRITY